MQFLTDLWLPILLSAVFVFIASSIIHMVVQWHNTDYGGVPDDEDVRAALRARRLAPGQYMLPHCGTMKEMATPEMQAKYEEGPVAFMTVFPNGPIAMGKSLSLWFLYCIVVSVFCAYIASFSSPTDADYMHVFRITGTVAVLAYGVAHMHDYAWKGAPLRVVAKFLVDGVAYGLVTAGTFGWLWPAA